MNCQQAHIPLASQPSAWTSDTKPREKVLRKLVLAEDCRAVGKGKIVGLRTDFLLNCSSPFPIKTAGLNLGNMSVSFGELNENADA